MDKETLQYKDLGLFPTALFESVAVLFLITLLGMADCNCCIIASSNN